MSREPTPIRRGPAPARELARQLEADGCSIVDPSRSEIAAALRRLGWEVTEATVTEASIRLARLVTFRERQGEE